MINPAASRKAATTTAIMLFVLISMALRAIGTAMLIEFQTKAKINLDKIWRQADFTIVLLIFMFQPDMLAVFRP
jgi:hypothetical protein